MSEDQTYVDCERTQSIFFLKLTLDFKLLMQLNKVAKQYKMLKKWQVLKYNKGPLRGPKMPWIHRVGTNPED